MPAVALAPARRARRAPLSLVEQPAPSREVMGVRVHALPMAEAVRRMIGWAQRGEGRTVYPTGAHGVIEAQDRADFRAVLNRADLIVPDGQPVAWTVGALGLPGTERIYGPDLTLALCRAAAEAGLPIGLYGSTPETLALLQERLPQLAPGLNIACAISPPFRPLSDEEDAEYVEQIRASGARIVFVGLGCPRQEVWCDAHRERIPAVLVAVGAAFDFHAGSLRQAPALLQRAGLEWAFRLATEPKRLWRRYFRIVPRFAVGAAGQVLRARRHPAPLA
ncbi:MAG TPA: WecB/TagA/CpsF family glycosyltransferase [Rhodothermales bacterium]|nr:WecB/TagA/CpsF family glycosyltransferase [Rhodothermales bacterium]